MIHWPIRVFREHGLSTLIFGQFFVVCCVFCGLLCFVVLSHFKIRTKKNSITLEERIMIILLYNNNFFFFVIYNICCCNCCCCCCCCCCENATRRLIEDSDIRSESSGKCPPTRDAYGSALQFKQSAVKLLQIYPSCYCLILIDLLKFLLLLLLLFRRCEALNARLVSLAKRVKSMDG
jgi:hypothetical protein